MSPAAKRRKPAAPEPITVKATTGKPKRDGAKTLNGDVAINRVDEGQLTVTWVTSCARRSFTLEDLAMVVGNLEMLGEFTDADADVWLETRDSEGQYFVALLKDGRVYGSDAIPTNGGVADIYGASWTRVKRALDARSKPSRATNDLMKGEG